MSAMQRVTDCVFQRILVLPHIWCFDIAPFGAGRAEYAVFAAVCPAMNPIRDLIPFAKVLRFESLECDRAGKQFIVRLRSRRSQVACADCKMTSSRVHSYYPRQISDLAWAD